MDEKQIQIENAIKQLKASRQKFIDVTDAYFDILASYDSNEFARFAWQINGALAMNIYFKNNTTGIEDLIRNYMLTQEND